MTATLLTDPLAPSYTAWLFDRLTSVLRIYALDDSDAGTIALLREMRRQMAEFWRHVPNEQLAAVYQSPVGQAYRALLASGFQAQPPQPEEATYLQDLSRAAATHTVQQPEGLKAFLGAMLYYAPGKMKVQEADRKLPPWLLADYRAVFEADAPVAAPPVVSVPPTPAPAPPPPEPAPAPVPLWEDMVFLNRLLGCANLYYIDPDERSIAEELRPLRQVVGQIWAQTPFEELPARYQSEFGRRYVALLESGYQNEPLLPEEQSVVQELTGIIGQGIDRYPGLNALLAIMMYLPPGKMQVRDAASRLPAWLLPDYQRIFEGDITAPVASPPPPLSPTPPPPTPPTMTEPAAVPASGLPALAEDMVFLNRFLGLTNLYEIDPEDQGIIAQLRATRRQVAELWLAIPGDRLEAAFASELGRRYQTYLKVGFAREPLTPEEETFRQQVGGMLARGVEQPGGANALLAAMMYFPAGSMQVREARSRLPGWLLETYLSTFEPAS